MQTVPVYLQKNITTKCTSSCHYFIYIRWYHTAERKAHILYMEGMVDESPMLIAAVRDTPVLSMKM